MGGLLPIMWSTGTGSEVMQRIAVPMIGGMISSTLLTLIVIPAIYGVVNGWDLPAKPVVRSRQLAAGVHMRRYIILGMRATPAAIDELHS